MTRLVLVGFAAVSIAGSAVAAEQPAVLTLEAPKATVFGHTIDFAGRLTPAARGAQIRLYSGKAYVGATRLRSDGAYRFKVEVGRPGPFHTVWNRVRSRPVSVRIHPILDTEVTGSRVAGDRLSIVVRLEPASAGRVHVRVLRSGSLTYGRVVVGSARIPLDTRSLEPMRITVGSLPAKGYARVSDAIRVSLRAPALSLGSRGPFVVRMIERLADLGYVTPPARTVFDGDVQQSVYAFQKAQGLERTGAADGAFWNRLRDPQPIAPRIRTPRDHIEVDKRRQILLVVRHSRVAIVAPVSTAGIAGYYTPEGRFAIGRKIPGYDPSPLGVLYKPMYFYGGYAIHGNPSVPPYPASHGCVRVPNFVIDRLFLTEPYGEPVYVYS